MRQDCDICGEFVQCENGICADCRAEGHEDEVTKAPEKEEDEEVQSSFTRRSTR